MIVANAGDPVPPPAGPERPTSWGKALLIGLVLLTASGLRLVLTPLQEPARLDLHFTDIQMSMIQGVAKGLPIAIFSIPIGMAIDHWNRARLLLLLSLCWTVGTLWTAFAHDFTALFVARALVGFGSGSAIGVAISMISDLCMPARRGRLLLFAFVGWWIGVAVAFALGGGLYGHFTLPGTALVAGLAAWRQVLVVFGAFGVLTLIPLVFLREPTRHEREQRGNRILPALAAVWSRRAFLLPLFAGQMAGGMAEGASGIWAAPVLQRNFHLSPADFGGWMGAIILVGGLLGSGLGGLVADWGTAAKRRGGVLIGAVIATVFTTAAAAYPMMPSVPTFALALGILLLGCTVAQLIGATAVTVLLPNEERGVVMSVLGVLGTLVGLATAPLVPLLGGWLFGDDRHLHVALAGCGMATGIVALIGYVVAMANAPARRPADAEPVR